MSISTERLMHEFSKELWGPIRKASDIPNGQVFAYMDATDEVIQAIEAPSRHSVH